MHLERSCLQSLILYLPFSVLILRESNGLNIIDGVSNVWTTLDNSTELECKVDSPWMWCYWENLKETRKYSVVNGVQSSHDDGAITLSSGPQSCKLIVHLENSRNRGRKYSGNWKCHIADTDADNFKAESVLTLNLAILGNIDLKVEYVEKSRITKYSSEAEKNDLPHLLEKGKYEAKSLFSSMSEKNNSLPKTISNESLLILQEGKLINITCEVHPYDANPLLELSIWLSSSTGKILLSTGGNSVLYTPTIEDREKWFECTSLQENDYVHFDTQNRCSPKVRIISIPKILDFPKFIPRDSSQSIERLVTLQVKVKSDPPPLIGSIWWSINDRDKLYSILVQASQDHKKGIITTQTSTYFEIIEPSIYNIFLTLENRIFQTAPNTNITFGLSNSLGNVMWKYQYNKYLFQKAIIVKHMSIMYYGLIGLAILLSFLICIIFAFLKHHKNNSKNDTETLKAIGEDLNDAIVKHNKDTRGIVYDTNEYGKEEESQLKGQDYAWHLSPVYNVDGDFLTGQDETSLLKSNDDETKEDLIFIEKEDNTKNQEPIGIPKMLFPVTDKKHAEPSLLSEQEDNEQEKVLSTKGNCMNSPRSNKHITNSNELIEGVNKSWNVSMVNGEPLKPQEQDINEKEVLTFNQSSMNKKFINRCNALQIYPFNIPLSEPKQNQFLEEDFKEETYFRKEKKITEALRQEEYFTKKEEEEVVFRRLSVEPLTISFGISEDMSTERIDVCNDSNLQNVVNTPQKHEYVLTGPTSLPIYSPISVSSCKYMQYTGQTEKKVVRKFDIKEATF